MTDRSADSENHEIICPQHHNFAGARGRRDRSYTNWDAGPPQEPNNDPNFGGEDCTIKWNDGTTWNDVPCDFTYPCYCQDVKGGGY